MADRLPHQNTFRPEVRTTNPSQTSQGPGCAHFKCVRLPTALEPDIFISTWGARILCLIEVHCSVAISVEHLECLCQVHIQGYDGLHHESLGAVLPMLRVGQRSCMCIYIYIYVIYIYTCILQSLTPGWKSCLVDLLDGIVDEPGVPMRRT